jgi:hypothetical protein
MDMMKLVDRPIIRGAARLLDIGGVLAWRGARDHADASARLMDEAWAMFGVALKGCASLLMGARTRIRTHWPARKPLTMTRHLLANAGSRHAEWLARSAIGTG